MSMVMGGLGAMMRAAMDAFLGSLMLALLPPSRGRCTTIAAQQQLLCKSVVLRPGSVHRAGVCPAGVLRAPGSVHRLGPLA